MASLIKYLQFWDVDYSEASLHNELYFMRFIHVLFPYYAYTKCFKWLAVVIFN